MIWDISPKTKPNVSCSIVVSILYIYMYVIIESWWYQLNPIVMIFYIYTNVYTHTNTQCPIFAYEMVIYHMKYHHKLILTVTPIYSNWIGRSSPLSNCLVRVAFFVPIDIWGPRSSSRSVGAYITPISLWFMVRK